MEKKYETIFKQLRPITVPIGLKKTILERVQMEETRAARRVFAASIACSLASLVGLMWSIQLALSSLSQTGFVEYMSLLFSDTSYIATAWQPFLLSIIESLPYFALTVLVGAALVFFASSVVAAHNARRALSFAL